MAWTHRLTDWCFFYAYLYVQYPETGRWSSLVWCFVTCLGYITILNKVARNKQVVTNLFSWRLQHPYLLLPCCFNILLTIHITAGCVPTTKSTNFYVHVDGDVKAIFDVRPVDLIAWDFYFSNKVFFLEGRKQQTNKSFWASDVHWASIFLAGAEEERAAGTTCSTSVRSSFLDLWPVPQDEISMRSPASVGWILMYIDTCHMYLYIYIHYINMNNDEYIYIYINIFKRVRLVLKKHYKQSIILQSMILLYLVWTRVSGASWTFDFQQLGKCSMAGKSLDSQGPRSYSIIVKSSPNIHKTQSTIVNHSYP